MTDSVTLPSPASSPRDFRLFWAGQTISSLGNAVTFIAIPILVYELTGSALNLGLSSAAYVLPIVLFGLPIGAWADRTDRKRLMIGTDILRALVLLTIPLLHWSGHLEVWWIYIVSFLTSLLSTAFDACQFAAIPSLVDQDDLVRANGRIQASFSAATVVGPLLAGALIPIVGSPGVLAIDAGSFLVSALSLALIARSFNQPGEEREPTHLLQDIREGLHFVLRHPVLRSISAMMVLCNFVMSPVYAQLVLFSNQQLGADERQTGILFAADALGVVVISLLAGRLRKRWSFGTVALGSLLVGGVLTAIFGMMTSFWPAVVIWAVAGGFGILFNINSGSLRQSITPNHMLARVITVAMVASMALVPFGSILGGWLVERTGRIDLLYLGSGLASAGIALLFSLGPLGHADRYLPAPEPDPA